MSLHRRARTDFICTAIIEKFGFVFPKCGGGWSLFGWLRALAFAQAYTWAATVFVDEFDAGIF